MSFKTTENVSIKNVLFEVFGDEIAGKYTRGLSIVYSDLKDVYESAMNSLMGSDPVSAIKCLIFGLDINREYKELLHLSKTMTYGLSTKISASEAEKIRAKYGDLQKAQKVISKKIKELTKEHGEIYKELEELEKRLEQLKPGLFAFFSNFFKKRQIKQEINDIEQNRDDISKQIKELKLEKQNIDEVSDIDEYSKVLRIIVEVCANPSRFKWVKK